MRLALFISILYLNKRRDPFLWTLNHGTDRALDCKPQKTEFLRVQLPMNIYKLWVKKAFLFNYNLRLCLEIFNSSIFYMTECGCGYQSHLVEILKVEKPQREEKHFCQHQGTINRIPD